VNKARKIATGLFTGVGASVAGALLTAILSTDGAAQQRGDIRNQGPGQVIQNSPNATIIIGNNREEVKPKESTK
jgi:hypothetical protein